LLSIDLFKLHPVIGVGPGNFVKATLEQYPPEHIRNIWIKPGEKARTSIYRYGRLEVSRIKLKDKVYMVPLPVHNKYFLIMTELGVIGFSLFMWFIFRVYKLMLACLRASDTILLFAGFGITGAFWAILSYMSLDLFADDKTVELLLFVPVLIISLSQAVQNNEREISA
jgi:O-antigen ligase